MNDKELLELAAKAAGYTYKIVDDVVYVQQKKTPKDDWRNFDPLTDDGDALRLAVGLSLLVMPYPLDSAVRVTRLDQKDTIVSYGEPADPYAATRRAIVRAAAEVGKAMP